MSTGVQSWEIQEDGTLTAPGDPAFGDSPLIVALFPWHVGLIAPSQKLGRESGGLCQRQPFLWAHL
jgi:hypothetical protein